MIPTSWLYRLLGGALALSALLWLVQSRDQWRDKARANEDLFHGEEAAHAATVANYRAAAEQARQDDAANLARVKSEQATINERTEDDFETRIAAARALAERLHRQAGRPAADPGAGQAAPVPGVPTAAGSAPQGAGESELPRPDALIATEQAIQLDEIIKWIRAQHQLRADSGALPQK